MSKKFLTLDIGAATVALAEYERTGRGALKLLNYGTAALAAPLDAGNASTILGPALMEIVRSRGIRPGPLALSVSGQMVFPKFAAIPAAGGDEKFEQAVRFEVEQNIPFPIDEMICDRQVLGDTPDGDKSVMIVAAKIDQIEDITGAVVAAGFRPEIVDVAPLALTNAVRTANPEASEGCVVILDIGAKTTSLVIAEGERVYNRSIPIAGNNITREISQALGCTAEEAESIKLEKGYVSLGGAVEDEDEVGDRVSKVCRAVMTRLHAEISRSVNFYRSQQGGAAPSKLYLTGGSALLPQVDQFFAETLQIEVEFFNPFADIATGSAVDAEALEADAAFLGPTVGLALHLSDAAEFAINLLPPSIVLARAEKARIPVVAFAGVFLLAALALAYLAVRHESEVVDRTLEAVDLRAKRLEGFEKSIKAAEAGVESARAGAEELRALMASRNSAVIRIKSVREALYPGMWIERWEAGKVTVRGWKDELAEVVSKAAEKNGGKRRTAGELVMDRLKGSPAVDASSVKISDMKTVGRNALLEQFTVELKFK